MVGDADESRQSDLAVMDANEFKNKTRLQSILEARETVKEQRRRAGQMLINGEISADGRNILVMRAVRQYLEEVWNLLLRHAQQYDDVTDSTYLAQRKLGEVDFHGDRDPVVIRGLYDFLNCRERYTETRVKEIPWRHGDDKRKVERITHTVPLEVSKRSYLLINEFLDEEHDLDIQFEDIDDSLHTWGYDERDVNGDEPDAEVI